jgi:hypothetical protein
MKKVILDILEMFLDSLYGSVFVCIGVTCFVHGTDQKDLLFKAIGILLTCMGMVGIQCGAEQRADKKYSKMEEE